jgi:hypothetical protein
MSKRSALRYNSSKPRWDLLPPDALEALADLMTKNLEKYPPRNWEKGMAWGNCFAAIMRHSWKWWKGEDLDAESGHPHMVHVMWNAMALVSYTKRGVGKDDRPRPGP